MKITPDTNVLVRLLVGDDPQQHDVARRALDEAGLVVLTLPMLCELVWVLRRPYGASPQAIAAALRGLFSRPAAVFDRTAADAGLAMLDAGGDFADGVVAYEGRSRGGERFVSFDRKAVRLLGAQGESAELLR